MIATPREASGSTSGGSMTIFDGGSLPVSGMTAAGRQLSIALCAAAVLAHNTKTATPSRDSPLDVVYFRSGMFFPPTYSILGFVECEHRQTLRPPLTMR